MILLELEIEDYKQFRGKHDFAPGQNGVVAIIGPNGAGKTTLFEAIEWCLFQPREILREEIPPRSAPDARPRVRLRLAAPSGPIWEIERTLKKNSTQAEVRKITDESREVVVSGGPAVTAYVATKLVGLEHKAFVATFFTRQKELSFFGGMTGVNRRREVGRLLGLETIRGAQKLIGEARTEKQNAARHLFGQYEHESGARDFAAEKKEKAERLVETDGLIAASSVAIQDAEKKYNAAVAAHTALVERRDAGRQIETEIQRQHGIVGRAESSISAAREWLARLDGLEAERPALLERASKLAGLDEKVAALEVARERAQRRASLVEQRTQAETEVDRLIEDAGRQLADIPYPQFSPLRVTAVAKDNPIAALDQVLMEAGTIDRAATEDLLSQLREAVTEQNAVTEHEANLKKFIDAVGRFDQECRELTAGGDPVEQEKRESERRDNSLKDIAAHTSSISALEKSIADYDQLIARRVSETFEAICTMCGRPISEHESDDIRRHARERRQELEDQIARLRSEIARHQRQCGEIDELLEDLRGRIDKLNGLRGRIENGQNAIQTQQHTLDGARLALAKRMRALGRTDSVSSDEIAELQDRLACERAVEGLAATLRQIRGSLQTQLDRAGELTSEIVELGEVRFDQAELNAAHQSRDEARSATERLVHIDGEATRRPEHERTIAEAEASRTEAQTHIDGLEKSLAELQVDEFAIEDAQDEISRHLNEQRRQQHARDTHRTERSRIAYDLEQIDKDQERLTAVAKRAEEARVEADDLEHMYTEFNDFERFVARRVKPQLEDMTSELVRVVTENKYEAVVLDDDYGIKVFDGNLGPYAIEHFSGGERDVVALAARLALSRLIGSQAANPPSFLVLDEVFGSLDRDRRANLLDLLGSLSGSAESFQQLFVISHVDDVRASSAFTEVWRITELPDGSSRLENLSASEAAEDF
jgi:exonuclease SbcC